MIASMTGFGAATLRSDALQASVQARSVNHRFLELSVHLPRRLAALEPDLRRLAQARLRRGKLDLAVQARFAQGEAGAVRAAEGLVAELVRVLGELRVRHGLAGEVAVADIARFPGAIEVEPPADESERGREALVALVEQALDELVRQRRAEGENLERELLAILGRIEAAAARLAALSDESRAAHKAALEERLRETVANLGLDDGRLHQEVVRLVERSDVAEELARLLSHLELSRRTLAGGGPCGKQLDFLAQELMREANTVGSKASAAAMIHEVVALKGEIERLREQVQNVE